MYICVVCALGCITVPVVALVHIFFIPYDGGVASLGVCGGCHGEIYCVTC